jgi:FAD/FMN-containing dehydrogenase
VAVTSANVRRVDPIAIRRLENEMRGTVLVPSHPGYEDARVVVNAMIDKRPAVIVRPVDAADVIVAVDVAREHDLLLSVRGGGHSAPGHSTNDGGLVIDLSSMRHVVVDPHRRRASVGGGATLGEVDHATAPFGLAVPSGIISTTGVGGLTLGGGTGHLTRAHGLTCDSLVAADVVTADGRLLRADDERHPELFWALRGGGGNFGVVTNFEFELHAVDSVLGGPIFYDASALRQLLELYRDFMHSAPAQLGAFFGIHLAPPLPFLAESYHGAPVCLVAVCWPGDLGRGWDAIGPLLEHDAMIGSGIEVLQFAEFNRANDALAPPGLHGYMRGKFLDEITDATIDVHAEFGPKIPTANSGVHLYPIDGAAWDVPADATAFGHRSSRYSMGVFAACDDPADVAASVRWVRDYTVALEACAPGGGYVNFLAGDEGDQAVRASYGANYDRLAAIKLAYDPHNLFRMNQNIPPARAES